MEPLTTCMVTTRVEQSTATTWTRFGTPARSDASTSARSIDYAGLERVTGVKKDDKQSDIFFAGCMLYQILTGVPPMSDTRDRSQRLSVARFREIKPITTHEPDLPGSLVSVVNKAEM